MPDPQYKFPTPTKPISVPGVVFDGISAAWMAWPLFREQVIGTAQWCEKNGFKAAGEWIRNNEFRYGEAVYYGLVNKDTGEIWDQNPGTQDQEIM